MWIAKVKMPIYEGPRYENGIVDLGSLRKALSWLSDQGFIPGFMDGPQSVGTTMTMALSLESNQVQFGDGSSYKVKCNRKRNNSRITGFTKSPLWLRDWSPKRLLLEYGYENEKSPKSLMVVIGTRPNNQGLYLDFQDDSIFLCSPTGLFAMYGIERIHEGFSNLGSTIFISVDSKKIKGREYFHYKSSILIEMKEVLSIGELETLFSNGKLSLEIRMYLRENGSVRDHGFAFRLSQSVVDELYARESMTSSE